jgi:hypothetical protein
MKGIGERERNERERERERERVNKSEGDFISKPPGLK